MEYRDDLQELAELREQLDLLREKLRQQELINERAVLLVTQKGINRLNRTGKHYTAFGIFAVIYCTFMFHRFGFSDGFVLFTGVFLLICVVATYWMHHELYYATDVTRQNLVDMTRKVVRFRKLYSKWFYFSIPVLWVWCYLLYHDAYRMLENPEGFLIAGLVGGVIGGAIGLTKHFKTLNQANEVLRHLDELQQTER